MDDAQRDWTVLLRDGVPRDWSPAVAAVLRAMPGRSLLHGDAARAVRLGQGFVDVPLSRDEAHRVEAELDAAGLPSRALRWSEREPAEAPMRVVRLDFAADAVVPDFPWARVQWVHTVVAEPAPFFLPPEVDDATRTMGRVASGLGFVADVAGYDDVARGLKSVSRGVEALSSPVSPAGSAPELVVELLGLWAPRVHLPLDSFQHGCVPGEAGQGRRARLASLLQAVVRRAPAAKQVGWTAEGLARRMLDGVKALPAHEHKRLVSAWLTAKRTWPDAA